MERITDGNLLTEQNDTENKGAQRVEEAAHFGNFNLRCASEYDMYGILYY